jgi:hypothetical protein
MMSERFFAVLVAVLLATIMASPATATMPPLTPMPDSVSTAACQKWAAAQSEDTYDMWGLQDSGKSSRDIATLRLTLSCLGEKRPEIVGFGSSVGFDTAFCARNRSAIICKARSPTPLNR